MFNQIKRACNSLVQNICCRDYQRKIEIPEINEGMYLSLGNFLAKHFSSLIFNVSCLHKRSIIDQ